MRVHYFADSVVTLKGISTGLLRFDPQFKIDGGELLRAGELLGELEICVAGSDLFDEDLRYKIGECERIGSHAAHQVIQRLSAANAIVTLRVIDGERDPSVTWDLLGPMWTVLPQLSSGLTQVEGQGYYEGSQLIVALS